VSILQLLSPTILKKTLVLYCLQKLALCSIAELQLCRTSEVFYFYDKMYSTFVNGTIALY